MDWNDLRFVLALAREGSNAAAARRSGLDPTTVARRLRALESALDARLFERGARGEMRPTEAGEVVVLRAEAIEAEIGGLTAAVKGADTAVGGTVRVTAVPILVNRVLVPAARELLTLHPGLRVELVAESHDLSLTRREADIALRLARPAEEAGSRILAQTHRDARLCRLDAATDVGADAAKASLADLRGLDGAPAAGPVDRRSRGEGGRALDRHGQRRRGAPARRPGRARPLSAPSDRRGPCGGAHPPPGRRDSPPEREIRLLTHPDLRHLGRIAATLAWIEASLQPDHGQIASCAR